MHLILDSHVALWWLDPDGPVSPDVRDTIEDAYNEVVVSVASIWELYVKRAKGRLTMPDDLPVQLDARDVELLDITVDAGIAAAALPPHHGDPFDRMIVAQAMRGGYTVVTADRHFAAYGVPVLAAR
jgi:PIN domain nuclease of toxin-antitoxin system